MPWGTVAGRTCGRGRRCRAARDGREAPPVLPHTPGSSPGRWKCPTGHLAGPSGHMGGGGAARAREWAITIFADSELVGIQPPSKAELIARLHAAGGASQEAFGAPVRAARVGPEAGALCGVLCTGSPPAWIRQPAWGREGGIWPRSTEMANLESSRGQSDVGNESRDIGLPFKQRAPAPTRPHRSRPPGSGRASRRWESCRVQV